MCVSYQAGNGTDDVGCIVTSPGTTLEKRSELLNDRYRQQIKERIPSLLKKGERKVGVRTEHCGVKKMKTNGAVQYRRAPQLVESRAGKEAA